MANAPFPAGLPAPLHDGSAKYTPAFPNVVETGTTSGPYQRRRLFTAVPENFTCTLLLTGAQCTELAAFVANTLKDTLPCDWLDWRTGEAQAYVFTSRPDTEPVQDGKGLWKAALSMRTVP